MSGAAGITHCGQWRARVPVGLFATRLVCTRAPHKLGPHYSRWSRAAWWENAGPVWLTKDGEVYE